jgi:hypothetical protein
MIGVGFLLTVLNADELASLSDFVGIAMSRREVEEAGEEAMRGLLGGVPPDEVSGGGGRRGGGGAIVGFCFAR